MLVPVIPAQSLTLHHPYRCFRNSTCHLQVLLYHPGLVQTMRRALFIVTAVLAGTAAATQLPLGTEQAPSRPMSDPSFPQPGSGLDRLGGVGIGGSAGVPSGKGMTLADTLTVDRRGSVWWDYARDIGSVVSHAENIDGGVCAEGCRRPDYMNEAIKRPPS